MVLYKVSGSLCKGGVKKERKWKASLAHERRARELEKNNNLL